MSAVVPKLDRLARPVPDARDIGDGIAARAASSYPALGGRVCDPTDPIGEMFFNILATFAEFEVDLLLTREGMAVARAKGRLKGRRPKLSTKQQTQLRRMHGTGDYTITDLAELFNISRPTVYRTHAAVETVAANAAADNALSYFAFGSASGVSERRRAVSELLLAVPDKVARCRA